MAKRAPMTTGTARINDAELYYEVSGEGHPLVLIHDGLLDSRIWDEQFEVFSRSYKTIRYDARGHGGSSTPEGEFSHVEDLHALLEFLNVGRAHLLGSSNGGRIAVDFTLRYPETVGRLILAAPDLSGYRLFDARRREISRIFSTAGEGGAPMWAEMWLDDPFWAPDHRHAAARRKLRRLLVESFRNFFRFRSLPRERRDPPAAPRLPEIRAPTLVIIGGRDAPDNHAIADMLASDIPGVEEVVMSDIAHMPNVEEPEEFNRLVLSFLEKGG